MAEPVLPPLPDRGPEPADNPDAAEPPVSPAEAAEPGEENEVFACLYSLFCVPCFAFLAGVLGRLAAFSSFVWVGFVPVRFIAPFSLVCCVGVRLHLYRSPSRVGFTFTLQFYCLPCFFAQFYVVVSRKFFLPRYCSTPFRLFFLLCLYYFLLVFFPSAIVRTSFWACVCFRRFFIASAHFISALSWLYCSQCRYAPLLRIAIFVIVSLLRFVLWDRTVPLGYRAREMIFRVNKEDRERGKENSRSAFKRIYVLGALWMAQ